MRYAIILVGLLISCSQAITGTKPYQLADSNSDKDFLAKTIDEYRKKGFDYANPSLVIDGYLYKGTDLNSMSQLKLKKCEIKSIHFLYPVGAKNIYGQIGEGGIILIGTKKCEDKTELKITDSLKPRLRSAQPLTKSYKSWRTFDYYFYIFGVPLPRSQLDVRGKPMTKVYNEIFKQLLTEYHLPDDFSFSVNLPTEVQNILDDQIIVTDLGITLKSFDRLYKATQDWENQSIIEDNENHFHVDSLIEPADNKKAFMLGVKTLTLLADKFQREKYNGIRCWYSFQTPELGRLWAKQNMIDEEGDQYFISDRLSFYKLRGGEDVISINEAENKFWAILTIDT